MIVVVYVAVVNMIFCYEYKCIMLEHHSSREGHLIHWMFWWSILGDDLLQMSTEGHLVLYLVSYLVLYSYSECSTATTMYYHNV